MEAQKARPLPATKNGSGNLDQVEVFEGADDTAIEENYPALYFCRNYSTTVKNLSGADYESGWCLPDNGGAFPYL
ncbi:MAG: hypothetical protein J6O39_06660 [Treponema sp.]|nr:hypothetical protein [Treponema sp.]